jgi:hypothetical protein
MPRSFCVAGTGKAVFLASFQPDGASNLKFSKKLTAQSLLGSARSAFLRIFTDSVKFWVPHPRRVFVFAARVGLQSGPESHSLCVCQSIQNEELGDGEFVACCGLGSAGLARRSGVA